MIENLIPLHRKMVIYRKIIEGNENCPICFNDLNIYNHSITTCGHAFCIKCIFQYVTTEKEMCPMCRESYTYEELTLPFTTSEIHFIINTQVGVNQEIIEIPRRIHYIYEIKNLVFYLLYIILKLILYFKCMFFLYIMIVSPFKQNYQEFDYQEFDYQEFDNQEFDNQEFDYIENEL
jgi:hypothetical protein